MKKLFLVFSHTLTDDQQIDAEHNHGVTQFVPLPDDLREVWADISPEGPLRTERIDRIVEWLDREGAAGDLVLIQGEFGASFYLVDFCFHNGFVPVYATSKRVYEEEQRADGSVVRRHIFRHVNFREYRRWGSK